MPATYPAARARSLRRRAAVGAQAVGLHLGVDRRAAEAEPVEVVRPDGLAVAQDRRARQHVLELADVARPAVRLEARERLGGDLRRVAHLAAGEALGGAAPAREDVRREVADVLLALAQRWHLDRDHRE